ncbi:DNA primase [Candidatus Parcubacteria bacterium]|nr:DNA primase [Candidatus Parcubacteria bacterium]
MDSDVEKVKARLSIADVVGQYVQLKKAGRNMTARCPFHKERTPSFYVSPERGTYMCFGCGEKGDIFSFVQKMEGIDFPTALKQLAEKAGVTLEQKFAKAPEQKEKEERLRDICEVAVQFFEIELKRRKDIQQYLHTRAVTDETISAWRIGYAEASWDELVRYLQKKNFSKEDIVDAGFAIKSEKRPGEIFDRFRGRVIFPISDAGGVVGVSGRFFEKVPGSKVDGEPAKYVNSPETALFKKSRILYGYDKARNYIRKADCILLVEGQFDLILAHQSGLPFTVALSGTALTHEHLSLLGRLSKRLILALDADAAGLRAGLKSAYMALEQGFDVKVPTFPEGKDPADVAKENPELLKAAVRTSKTAIEFFLEALRPQAKDERSYKKLVESQVLPLVGAIKSKIDQEHFVRIVAKRIEVSEDAVRAEVAKRLSIHQAVEESSSEIHKISAEFTLSPLEKKIGMLLFYFLPDSDVYTQLKELVGIETLTELQEKLKGEAESLRFRFEHELGEHTTPETIAADMLQDIKRHLERERFKMKFL